MDEQFLTKRRSETRIQTQLLSQHGGLATSYTKKWMVQIMSCTMEKEEKKLSPTFASFNFLSRVMKCEIFCQFTLEVGLQVKCGSVGVKEVLPEKRTTMS